MSTNESSASRADEVIASRGSVTAAELGAPEAALLELASARPDLEPVFLVRFRSRQGKVRVEEIRSYAWPSQKIALSHMGYRAEDARLLRLEPRQPVPFPERLYARFEKTPKVLEELRAAEKAYQRAMKQAPSKPGRAERDVLPLQAAFKKLGDDVALEMWIESAATFQRLDNPTYASKMLGNLLKLIEKEKKIEPSVLARTVLSAADDGVFNAKLYEFTWDLIAKRLSMEAALGFGLRVFRRLMTSGRALPGDFTKDLRNAALKAKVTNFEALYDSTIVWAAGIASFWNTSKKTASWRDEATQDHGETALLRKRLGELWTRAKDHADGERWRSEIWGRIEAVMPELTPYGRTVVVENLRAFGIDSRPDAERLLGATLALVSRAPRSSDRDRVEQAATEAMFEVVKGAPDLLWERAASLEEALRTASGNLASFVSLHDLLSDVSDALEKKDIDGRATTVLRSLPGLEAAWAGALVAALQHTEGVKKKKNDDDEDESASEMPIPALIGEALSLMTPGTAAEHLAELGPLMASRLARDLSSGEALDTWERVLSQLSKLGPLGDGVTSAATQRFVESSGRSTEFAHAAALVHQLDADVLRAAAESPKIVDEALEVAIGGVGVPPRAVPLLRPEKELGDNIRLVDLIRTRQGDLSLLWATQPKDRYSDDPFKQIAITRISPSLEQRVVATGDLKGAAQVAQWEGADGVRLLSLKEKTLSLLESDLKKAVAKIALDEEGYYWDAGIIAGRKVALLKLGRNAMLLDQGLKLIGELQATGWGEWSFLEGPEGTQPIVLHSSWRGIDAAFIAPDKKVPTPKLADLERAKVALRTDDGEWFIEYENKKSVRKRARYDESKGAWVGGAGDAPIERTVVDSANLSGDGWLRSFRADAIGYVERDENVVVHDWQGRPVAALVPGRQSTCFGADIGSGVAVFEDGIVVDDSLPARIQSAGDLRAAITGEAEPALPRALYSDRAALARHLVDRIARRERGKAALSALGDAGAALIDAAAGALLVALKARETVLGALESEKRATATIPPHVAGVRRTAVRRAVRSTFSPPLDGSVFWALDGDTPRPLIEQLFPASGPVRGEAWGAALKLLALCQNPKTERAVAERALACVAAIAEEMAKPERRFEIAASSPQDLDDVDEDFELDTNDPEGLRSIEGGYWQRSLLWYPRGKYPKKDPPFAWSDDPERRRKALADWVEKGLLGPAAPRSLTVVADKGPVKIHRAEVAVGATPFVVDVITHHRSEGLDWALSSLSGIATLAEWHTLFGKLEAGFAEARCDEPSLPLVWPHNVPRTEDLEALGRGVTLTRERLDDRESLRAERWPAPEIKGLDDQRHARFVLLAWVLGRLEASDVGSTNQVFEKISKSTKLIRAWYGTMEPQRGDKSGDEVKLPPELIKLRLTALMRTASRGRSVEELVVLTDPAVIAEAFAKELAPTGTKAGGRSKP